MQPNSNSGGYGGYNSPLREVAKQADDLRQERKKASLAMQEGARLRIEIESLKQTIEQYHRALEDLRDKLAEKDEEIDALHCKLGESDNVTSKSNDVVLDVKKEIDILTLRLLESQQEKDIISAENGKYRESISLLENKIRLSESVQIASDNSFAEVNVELHQLKWKYGESEKTIDHYKTLYGESLNTIDELRKQISQHDLVREKLTHLQLSYTDMKRNYESSLKQANESSQKESSFRQESEQLKKTLVVLQEEKAKLIEDFDKCARDNTNLETSKDELMKHLQAEQDKYDSAELKNGVALKAKVFLEQQVQRLERERNENQSRELELDNDLALAKERNSNLELELGDLKEEISRLKLIESSARGAESTALEIEILKNNLSDVKRQLIRREIGANGGSASGDGDYAATAPNKLVAEREHQTRKVYENIIIDLRGEIDKLQRHADLQQVNIEKYAIIASDFENLKMEMDLYKAASRNISVEKESYATTASEAMERSSQVSHDKDSLIREVIRLESELQSKSDEFNRIRSDLDSERVKRKELYNEKLAADRKLAEFMALKNKSEASLEDERQMRLFDMVEVERTNKINVELREANATLKLQARQLEQNLRDLNDKYAVLTNEYGVLTNEDNESKFLLLSAQQSISDFDTEREHLQKKIKAGKVQSDSLSAQIKRFVSEIEVLKNDKDGLRRKVTKLESMVHAESLNFIRSNIDETALHAAQTEISDLNAELSREKEKTSLLKSQLDIAEERIDTLNREISVFRTVDVYKYSMSKELNNIRQSSHSSSSIHNDKSLNKFSHNNKTSSRSNNDTNDVIIINSDNEVLKSNSNSSNISALNASRNRSAISIADLENNHVDKSSSNISSSSIAANKKFEMGVNIKQAKPVGSTIFAREDKEEEEGDGTFSSDLSDLELIRKKKQDRHEKRIAFVKSHMTTVDSRTAAAISPRPATTVTSARDTRDARDAGHLRIKINDLERSISAKDITSSNISNNNNINNKNNNKSNDNNNSNSNNNNNKSRTLQIMNSSEPLKFDFERAKRILGNM